MKKKWIVINLFASVLLVSGLASSVEAANENEAVSKGSVDFKHRTNPEPGPFDPTDPTVPPREVEAENKGEGAGTTGLLRFDRVPNFKFETIEIRGQDQTGRVLEELYTVRDSSETFYAAPTVEISDERGTWDGWTAFVSIEDEFKNIDNPAIESIEGFQLKLNHAEVAGYSGITENPGSSIKPTFKPMTLNNKAQAFASAAKNAGMAQWGISFYGATASEAGPVDGKPGLNATGTPRASEAVTLMIPANATKVPDDRYVANLTWYLALTPDATEPQK